MTSRDCQTQICRALLIRLIFGAGNFDDPAIRPLSRLLCFHRGTRLDSNDFNL